LDPKWADAVSVKVSNSGLQHVSWFELRGKYGAEYWKKFAELKPRAFDSYVQQYDRLVNQQDKVIHTAQYSGYLEWKAKGAPVAFNVPPDGMPATPETWGILATAPQRGRLSRPPGYRPVGGRRRHGRTRGRRSRQRPHRRRARRTGAVRRSRRDGERLRRAAERGRCRIACPRRDARAGRGHRQHC